MVARVGFCRGGEGRAISGRARVVVVHSIYYRLCITIARFLGYLSVFLMSVQVID